MALSIEQGEALRDQKITGKETPRDLHALDPLVDSFCDRLVACPEKQPVVFVARDEGPILEAFRRLEALSFHCGCIEVFQFKGPEPPQPDFRWPYVFSYVIPEYVSQRVPRKWFLPPHQVIQRDKGPPEKAFCPVQNVYIFPVVPSSRGAYLFLVRPPEDSHGHGVWKAVGGGVKRGHSGDPDVDSACMREWQEEAMAWPYGDCFEAKAEPLKWIVWKANSSAWANWCNCSPDGGCYSKKDGWSATAWTFALATPDFFRKSAEGAVCHLVSEAQEVVKGSDAKERIHSEGLPFLEVDSGKWFHLCLDEEPPRLYSQCAGAKVRGDLGYDLLTRPSELRDELLKCTRQWQRPEFDDMLQQREPWEHAVEISADGMCDKLEILHHNLRHLSPQDSSERLVSLLSRALQSPVDQFYSEEIQVLLERRADPTQEIPTGGSPLDAVRRNEHLNPSVRKKTIWALEDEMKRRKPSK